jgi:hypothetical protein
MIMQKKSEVSCFHFESHAVLVCLPNSRTFNQSSDT